MDNGHIENGQDNEGGGMQDLLSAALDECGLGDFFGADQVSGNTAESSSHSMPVDECAQYQTFFDPTSPQFPQTFQYHTPVASPIVNEQWTEDTLERPSTTTYIAPESLLTDVFNNQHGVPQMVTINGNGSRMVGAPDDQVIKVTPISKNISTFVKSSIIPATSYSGKIIIKSGPTNTNPIVKPVGTSMTPKQILVSTAGNLRLLPTSTLTTATRNIAVKPTNTKKATISMADFAKMVSVNGSQKVIKVVEGQKVIRIQAPLLNAQQGKIKIVPQVKNAVITTIGGLTVTHKANVINTTATSSPMIVQTASTSKPQQIVIKRIPMTTSQPVALKIEQTPEVCNYEEVSTPMMTPVNSPGIPTASSVVPDILASSLISSDIISSMPEQTQLPQSQQMSFTPVVKSNSNGFYRVSPGMSINNPRSGIITVRTVSSGYNQQYFNTTQAMIRPTTSAMMPTTTTYPNSMMMIRPPQMVRILNGNARMKGNSLFAQQPMPPRPPVVDQETRERLEREAQQKDQDQKILLEEVRRLIEEEDDELTNLDTFNDYMPAKLKLGSRHPDQVVETASLASIPPPDISYQLEIPAEAIDQARLSALQLESIIYASQQHEHILPSGERAGFLIGDGAGVGKGRTVAGVIYENYLRGRKRSLWFSVSSDLRYDAQRDLLDIGAGRIEINLLNRFKYGYKIHSPENDNVKRGIIFSTYSSLIGESNTVSGRYSTRFNQIVQWCGGEDFDGVIIFDECHKAKNLWVGSGSTRATKTGASVLELQKSLPKARVVYASATGATEPRNMGYMTRLGIWGKGTPFEDFPSFVQAVEKRGVGAMELVAIDLKMRGMYMARQLSFKGVTFRIEHVPLSREFIRIYNCCCRLWVSAKVKFEKALELMGAETPISKAIWTQFWASHQRFFKYLCIASKVKFAVAYVKEALRANKAVVIGLQSTGEARTLEQLEDNGGELNDFVSTAKSVFQSLIEKHFPAPNRKKLAKILGRDTAFFDQLGIKLSRDDTGEVMANYVNVDQEGEERKVRAGRFYNEEEEEEDSDDDDFIEVSDKDDNDDESDIDSDELEDIDDLMDEKLGLKQGKSSNAVKFMDILFGPSENGTKRKKSAAAKRKKKKKIKQKRISKKSMKGKYDKFYSDFDKVSDDVGGYCESLKEELIQQLESFGERLPPNTLDELIDELGGPENVAEMTGRKGRVVSNEEGVVTYEARTENDVSLEMLNLVEKQRFMDDEKRVAIISEAASSGISLHADRRVKNRWRRVHLTVELPWSADRAIQQFGRTHRSNQVSAPEYVFLISNLAGEKRFASIVAKRLESLGALTHGDRRATESRDLSQFNIDTKYGRQALETVMKLIAGQPDVKPLVELPEDYAGDDFFDDCRVGLQGVGLCTIDRKTDSVVLDKDYGNINKFLNRILGLEVHLQNTLFRYFNDTMDALIKQAKRAGRYDSGIIDLSSEVGNVQRLNEENFIMKSPSGAIKVTLHTVLIDRGMDFEKASQLYRNSIEEDDWFRADIGFYLINSTLQVQVRKTIFLAVPETNVAKNKDSVKQSFRIYKPSLGLQSKYETKTSLHAKGTKLEDMTEIERLWREHYDQSETKCTHMFLFGKCKQTITSSARRCDVGLRKRTYCILTGSMLTTWPELEKRIPMIATHKLQIVRLKTDDGKKYIGPMVPPHLVENVRATLNEMANA